MGWNSTTKVLTLTGTGGGGVKIGNGYQGDLELALGRSNAKSHIQLIGDVNSSNQVVGAINKWAFHKPIRLNKIIGVTDTDIASVNCGLQPVSLTKMLAKSANMTTSSYTKSECLAEIAEWTYLRPRGSSNNEPYRFFDFDGYKANSVAPDGGWTSVYRTSAQLDTLKGVTVTETASTSVNPTYDTYNKKISAKNGTQDYADYYQVFSMKIGTGSDEKIVAGGGDTDNMNIPISYIAPVTGSVTGFWRVALAVWLPNSGYQPSEETNGAWYYYICRESLYNYHASPNTAKVLPDFASNPYLTYRLRERLTGSTTYLEFVAVPVLIKNIGSTQVTIGNKQYYMPNVVSGVTEIYCMPSGSGAFYFGCGTPTTPHYWSISTSSSSGTTTVTLTNTDSSSSHTYKYNTRHGSTVLSTVERSVPAGGTITALQGPTANNPNIVVIEQDGNPV